MVVDRTPIETGGKQVPVGNCAIDVIEKFRLDFVEAVRISWHLADKEAATAKDVGKNGKHSNLKEEQRQRLEAIVIMESFGSKSVWKRRLRAVLMVSNSSPLPAHSHRSFQSCQLLRVCPVVSACITLPIVSPSASPQYDILQIDVNATIVCLSL